MKTCRTSGCKGVPSPSFAWCDPCLVTWGKSRRQPAPPAAPRVEAVVAPVTVLDVVPDGFHRCTNCTSCYPVLVDDVLCVRCDSILYPTSTIPAAAPVLATAPVRGGGRGQVPVSADRGLELVELREAS